MRGPDARLTRAVWPADGVRVTPTTAMVSAAAETLSGFQVETKGSVSTSVQLLPDSPWRDAITMWQAEINQTLCPNSTLHTHSQSSLCGTFMQALYPSAIWGTCASPEYSSECQCVHFRRKCCAVYSMTCIFTAKHDKLKYTFSYIVIGNC